MELTFTQWQALEQQARDFVYSIFVWGPSVIAVLWLAGSLLYGFINDKEGV